MEALIRIRQLEQALRDTTSVLMAKVPTCPLINANLFLLDTDNEEVMLDATTTIAFAVEGCPSR